MKPKIDSLESERLLLEVRQESHATEVYKLLCEKDLYHYMKRDVPESVEWLANGFKELERLTSPDGKELWLGWVARDKGSQNPTGIFELTIVNSEAFIAYTIFKEYWGKEYALEGTRAMINYAACTYVLSRFVIEMDTRNRASTKVAEKLGFHFVKVTSNACFLKNFVSHEFQFEKMI